MQELTQVSEHKSGLLSTKYLRDGGLTLDLADQMIENCIGMLSLPLGLGLNFLINGTEYVVPMVIEEPSVIAAVSGSAKLIKEHGGGFKTWSSDPLMIGQIQVLDVDPRIGKAKIEDNVFTIISRSNIYSETANSFIPRMVNRGGGVLSVIGKILDFNGENGELAERVMNRRQMLVVELNINVCDSMGANMVNTVCEKIAPTIQEITGGRVGLRILSNLCIHRKAGAQFKIPCDKLTNSKIDGNRYAQLLMEAYLFAVGDIFRGATHNKGIMNGIDGVALATGQDWRAVESAAHSYASIGQYKPLTTYLITTDASGTKYIEGRIEVPISVGTRGGVTHSNPLYIQTLEILKNPSSNQLAEIMAAVGLAQNFAALRALAFEGIQKGHMKLHARNIAISAGIPLEHIEDAVKYLIEMNDISVDRARQFILENQHKMGDLF